MFKLVALVMAVAAVAAPAAAAQDIQIKGGDAGSFSLELIGPNLFRSTDVSSGVASHLGPYDFLAHEIYDANQNVVTSAEFTITTRHGTLFGNYTATLGVGATPNIGTYHAPGSVTGGTGRYAGASGTIVFDGYGDFDTYALVDHFTASVDVPDSDSTSRTLAAADPSAARQTQPSTIRLSAPLDAQQVVGGQDFAVPGAHGLFTATLTGMKLHWRLTYSGLSGAALGAHIHIGKPGVSKWQPVLGLCGFLADTPKTCRSGVTGTSTIHAGSLYSITSRQVLKAILEGDAYVNVHTNKNYNWGEIRGQITVEK
jgi:hypothetical protein